MADVFLSSLRASAADCSMKTTSAASTSSIYAATLESYRRTRQEQRRLRSAKKKSLNASLKKPRLKSTNSDVPF